MAQEEGIERGIGANQLFRLCAAAGAVSWMRPLPDGSLVVQAEVEDREYTMLIYGRENPSDGKSRGDILQFSLPISIDAPSQALLERINSWNMRAVLSKAFLDSEGDVIFDMAIPLAFADDTTIQESIVVWQRLVAEFVELLSA